MRLSRAFGRLALAVVAGGLVSGCEGEPTGFSGVVSVSRFFAGVYAVMPGAEGAPTLASGADKSIGAAAVVSDPVLIQGVLREGQPPALSGAPGAFLVLESSVVTGMPAKARVTGESAFTTIAVSVAGAEGYWEISLPSAVTDIQVVVTGSSSMPNTSFAMEAAVGLAGGYGRAERLAVQAVDLASSDVAVILRWNAYSDVDLHVTDGKGTKVYFGNPSTSEGGRLDLDSNPACDIDGVNQEVITWPLGQAPVGEYKVEVDYWSDCGVARSDYAVTFMLRGRTVQVINGQFDGQPTTTRHEVARFTFP